MWLSNYSTSRCEWSFVIGHVRVCVCLCVCVSVCLCVECMWRIIAQKPLAWLIWYLAQSFMVRTRWCTSIFYFEKNQDGRFTAFFCLKNHVTHCSSKTVGMIDLKFGKKFYSLCLLMHVWFLFLKKSKWSHYSPFSTFKIPIHLLILMYLNESSVCHCYEACSYELWIATLHNIKGWMQVLAIVFILDMSWTSWRKMLIEWSCPNYKHLLWLLNLVDCF